MSKNPKSEFMLLFRGTDWHNGLSPEETQLVMDQWMAWFNRLTEQGKAKSGQPLVPDGKIVSGKNRRGVADGPFVESKEAIAGYFLLLADNLDEAVAIAQECPGLNYGAIVEVRPVAPMCPVGVQAVQEPEIAQASE